MSEPIRVGIIGCGQMGRIHARGYQKAGAQVVAVADVHGDAARALADELGAEAYTDYREMLDAGGLDAVSIATPPAMHREHAVASARAGLPLFCEKPLAESLPSARALVEEVDATGMPMMVGFFHRFHEPLVKLKELVETGAFGHPITIRSRFSIAPAADRRAWVKDPSIAGGGAMLDTAVHSMDIIRFLTGAEIDSVQAVTDGKPMEETTLVILQGSGGALGLVEAYATAPFRGYELWLQGSRGEAKVGWDPPSLQVRTLEEPQWRDVPVAAPDAMARFHAGIAYFATCIRDGQSPDRATGTDGVKALELAEAAYRAARTGVRELLGQR